LRLGGIAAAGAAVAVVANAIDASPADAASGGNMILGSVSNDGGLDETGLSSSSPLTLYVTNDQGIALGVATNDSTALSLNNASAQAALTALNAGSGAGLELSDNSSGTDSAIHAHLDNTSSASNAVVVSNAGSGYAIDTSDAGVGTGGAYART
jgi:hypothetical protein